MVEGLVLLTRKNTKRSTGVVEQFDEARLLAPPKPFVKWAGGKRRLLSILEQKIPAKFGTYFEPFLGGGAMLFHILSFAKKGLGHPSYLGGGNNGVGNPCKVSDLNPDLVLTYVTIRDKVDDLIYSLRHHAREYSKNPHDYYYYVRGTSPRKQTEKASRLIFLNRTCFNGLYRVNSKGQFNVPLGKYANPNIVDEQNLRAVSYVLQNNDVDISCRDFSSILDDVSKNDFVYFDPPYKPVSATSFTSYTDRDFNDNDLKKLVDLCIALSDKGVKVMMSNSFSKEFSYMFPAKKWSLQKISVNRMINADPNKRTGHRELLICNY